MELLPVHAIHPRFTSSSIIPDILDEPIRSLRRPAPPARPLAPGPTRKACCWSRRKTVCTP